MHTQQHNGGPTKSRLSAIAYGSGSSSSTGPHIFQTSHTAHACAHQNKSRANLTMHAHVRRVYEIIAGAARARRDMLRYDQRAVTMCTCILIDPACAAIIMRTPVVVAVAVADGMHCRCDCTGYCSTDGQLPGYRWVMYSSCCNRNTLYFDYYMYCLNIQTNCELIPTYGVNMTMTIMTINCKW